MGRYLSKSILLLTFAVAICCGLYPLVLWTIGQTFFPEQANGSLLRGPDGQPVGSRLIAQPFTKDEYFQPRPSAVSYDASASAPSNLAASNYLLRARVASTLGPIVTYRGGEKAGQPVGPDVETWFQRDLYGGQPHLVAQWADAHNSLAQAWVKGDPSHAAFVTQWVEQHPDVVAQWVRENPDTPEPTPVDLAVLFFEHFSLEHPGRFPAAVTHETPDGKAETVIEPVPEGTDIQATFFDMWRQEHADADLADVPSDLVMTSGSGLDPHITLDNAMFQLDRVASAWAKDTGRDPAQVQRDIQQLLQQNASAPFGGAIGVKMVNVLELNLALRQRYGAPA